MTHEFRGFRAAKCYEGQGPFVLWQVNLGAAGKRHLIADATQRTFGVRLDQVRPDDLKTDGAVVATMRKHARTAGIGRILKHEPTGDVWIPLYTSTDQAEGGGGRSDTATFWVQLAMAAPPELRFIAADRTILVRKSSQGTYTKRRTLETPLPTELPPETLVDLTPTLLASVNVAANEPAEGEDTAPTSATGTVDLPEYQRLARDRLARRVKTVRKSVERQNTEKRQASDESRRAAEARLLQDHLHLVTPGLSELAIETADGPRTLALDPELTPGQNLTAYFDRVKKAKRAAVTLGAQAVKAEESLAGLEADLAHVRAGPLSLLEVEFILRRHKLPLDRPETTVSGAPVALPYRAYLLDGLEFHVGRSAAESDAMVKAAKANDYWFHAVGIHGSHVIIPARQLRGELPLAAMRMAGILALHHSKAKDDLKGEVYVTRRQHIKKRKGMAPGLWQVDKAETLFFSYDPEELSTVLGRLKP